MLSRSNALLDNSKLKSLSLCSDVNFYEMIASVANGDYNSLITQSCVCVGKTRPWQFRTQ